MIGARVAACLCACFVLACRSGGPLLLPPSSSARDAEPELDTRVRIDPDTGVMTRQWQVLVAADGRKIKHGFERGWFPDGTHEFERAFVEGESAGFWRSWFADGTLRSEYEWAVDERATLMRYWHANGKPSAEGLAIRGRREGHWTYWYESGSKSEEGQYRGNARHGEWVTYREDGSVRSRGSYANDRRVGEWQHPPDPHLPALQEPEQPKGAAADQ